MELTESQKQKIEEIAQKYQLKLVLFFGSRIKTEKYLHQESDFDIAYLSKNDLDLMKEVELICDLMPVFKSENIDLVNLEKASPLLRYEISKNCEMIYGNKENLFDFKASSFRAYINHLPLLELEEFLIKKRQKLLAQSIYGG